MSSVFDVRTNAAALGGSGKSASVRRNAAAGSGPEGAAATEAAKRGSRFLGAMLLPETARSMCAARLTVSGWRLGGCIGESRSGAERLRSNERAIAPK